MKNFVQPGNVVTVAAPTGGVKSGDLIVVGALAGICATDAAQTEDVEIALTGVFTLAKAAGKIDAGAAVWWDAGNSNVANASAAGLFPIGAAVAEAASSDTTVRVRLSGIPTAAAGG
jgi:predicted RecA/RadA family phage recombinase